MTKKKIMPVLIAICLIIIVIGIIGLSALIKKYTLQNDKNFNQLFIELAPAEFRGFMIITTDSTNLWEGGF